MILRTLFTAGLFFAAFALAPLAARAEAPTIAIVDVGKVLAEAKAAQSLQKQIQSRKETFQKEFAAKEKELKTTETALITEREKLSAEEFDKKYKAFQEKIFETRKLFQKRSNSLEGGLSKAMQELRKNIVETAASIADAKGYDIVLTRDSVLIAEKSLDITADVLKALDVKISDIKLQVE